jgi:serine/threonine protein kinase
VLQLEGFCEALPSLIYEYCPSGSLADLLNLEEAGSAPDGWCTTKKQILIFGVADAMSWLYSKRIINRNLCPSNVVLDDHLYPLVGDVGITRELTPNPAYAAPDLLAGDLYKSKVDM